MSLLLMVLLLSLTTASWADGTNPRDVARSQFPRDFLFGTASSAYQVCSTTIWKTCVLEDEYDRVCCSDDAV
jgi:hypothetical protein